MDKKVNVVKPNEVNAAYLFLGIGGCGCEIVKRVAKRCHQEERNNISFVCMDTDVNDLKSIKDEFPFFKTIQTSTTQTVGAFLDNDDDARRNWFPKSAVMYDKTMSEGAGQVRAISRLALDATIKTGKIRPLLDGIDDLFRKTGNEMKQSMRCIIASSSSGGTGSGMILPIAMYIRSYVKEKYPNSSLLTRALLLLPETLDSVIDSQTERDSQARNGYATIKELNAFMMKGSGFVDLDPDLKQYAGLNVKIPVPGSDKLKELSTLPIDFCFLMDGQDAEDSTLMGYDQYKEQAAIALYEQNIGPMQRKAASTEDNIIKELAKSKGRNRFGGVGAGIVRYPYERLVDYVACDLAIDSVGGEGDASKWTKYDKEYKNYVLKCKKEGVPSSQMQSLGDIYMSKMDSDNSPFTKDLKNNYVSEASARIESYIKAFEEFIKKQIYEDTDKETAGILAQAAKYKKMQEYDITEANVSAGDGFAAAKNLVNCINKTDKNGKYKVSSFITSKVEGLFSNTSIQTGSSQAETFSLEGENVMYYKNNNEIAHPCAARYIMYALSAEMKDKVEKLENEIKKNQDKLEKKISSEEFSFSYINKNKLYSGMQGLEEAGGNLVKKKAKEEYFETVDSYISACVKLTFTLYEQRAIQAAYIVAKEYVDEICTQYENFFKKFEDNVKKLDRDKEDIVNELRYKKGNSVLNVCSSEEIIKHLSKVAVNQQGKDSTLLTPEINGAIFDQIKKNAIDAIDRRNAGDDLTSSHTKDIFTDTLMDHFKKEIKAKCDFMNVDIINAMALEYRLGEEIKAKADNSEFYFKQNDAESYIKTLLEKGARIAAPSIQKLLNEEPRMISRVAYSKELLDNRQYNVKTLLEKGDATDTVSIYEIRFFNALYNITPDKLKKFAAPLSTETGFKEGGVYYKAYHAYSKHIGPDSTKNSAMSTHIDKRWDSIKVMPELDENYQGHIVKKIHKAFIYGIIHGAIRHEKLSNKTGGKYVYIYNDSDDRKEQLVVPNGTLCDEFYEILDALYVNAKVVEDINERIKRQKRALSLAKNCNYNQTEFFKDMAAFDLFKFYKPDNNLAGHNQTIDELTQVELKKIADEIEDDNKNNNGEKMLVENKTSLFAIPMVYYYSLPNSGRFESELIAMIDAVIDVFREEFRTWEKEEDAKFVLCNRLIREFNLLKNNYSTYVNDCPEMNIPALDENIALDIIRRKIQEELRTSPEPEDYEDQLDKIAKHN